MASDGFSFQFTSDGNRHFRIGCNIEVFENWLFDTITYVDGIPVISVPGLITMKKRLGREKDLMDIEKIRMRTGMLRNS